MRRKFAIASLLLLSLIATGPTTRSDDTDILWLVEEIEPNIVFLIDTSGSMNDQVGGQSKISIARNVVANLIQNLSGANVAIFSFNDSSDGARLVAPVGTPVATMVAAIQDLDADGYTPLGQSAHDVQRYFDGTYGLDSDGEDCEPDGAWDEEQQEDWDSDHGGRAGNNSGNDSGNNSGNDSGNNSGNDSGNNSGNNDGDNDGDNGGDSADCVPVPSPITSECQSNFAILMTDGMPTNESVNLVAEVATSMYAVDHSATLPGMQQITVHTIGFDVPAGRDLLTRTASNGGGRFFTASTAAELQQAFEDAVGESLESSNRFSTPIMPATSAGAGNRAYMATFAPVSTKAFWKGYFAAYQRDAQGHVPTDLLGVPMDSAKIWDAGELLATRAASTRTIYTVTSNTRRNFATTTTQITAPLLGYASGDSTNRTNTINFVRGVDTYDEDGDGNTSEQRTWKLGDVFHSTPVLVVAPPNVGNDASYDAFRQANLNRTEILLVGANDGMLHAFRESDGSELWAFIPPDLLDDLRYMRPTYTTHPYYVDGSPIVTDIKVGANWKTIAVFGLRRGGRHYYALDITDPASPAWMWGFTDARMGETWSDPAIGKVRMSNGTVKYVAFVGGGYDTASNNATGKAVFAIDLSNGSKLWQYYNTGSGTNDWRSMNFSVAATPSAVDLNGDGFVDRVYVGDVGGQLWKFDVSAPATTSAGLVNNWTGKRLFAALPSQANPPLPGAYPAPRAMYGSPVAALDPTGALWVFVGTGDRNQPLQASDNRFYGIKDDATMAQNAHFTETALVDATATNSAITQGWYLPLGAREKVLGRGEVYQNAVIFSTYTPTDPVTCDAPTGSAGLYAVQMTNGDAAFDWDTGTTLTGETGDPRGEVVGGGLPTSPTIVQGSTHDSIVVGTSNREVVAEDRPTAAGRRVRYWREVF